MGAALNNVAGVIVAVAGFVALISFVGYLSEGDGPPPRLVWLLLGLMAVAGVCHVWGSALLEAEGRSVPSMMDNSKGGSP